MQGLSKRPPQNVNSIPSITLLRRGNCINTQDLQALGQKQATRQALAEISTTFTNAFDSSFTNLLVKHSKEIQKKPTAAEKKRLRSIYRRCRDQENEALKKSAAISVLTEDESVRAYQRKRKRQYFESKNEISPP